MIDYKKIKLSAEEKKLLKANAMHLKTAYKSDYSLPVFQRDLIALNDMYIKHISKNGFNISCSKCILKLLKGLYPLAEANNLV